MSRAIHTWLIHAITTPGEDLDAWLFGCRLSVGNRPADALKEAWRKWVQEEEGRDYVLNNSTNWGDSVNIPDRILKMVGIEGFWNAEGYQPSRTGGEGRIYIHEQADHKIAVYHDDLLIQFLDDWKEQS